MIVATVSNVLIPSGSISVFMTPILSVCCIAFSAYEWSCKQLYEDTQ